MKNYFINHNTGAGNVSLEGTLDEAIKLAIEDCSNTGKNVDIFSFNDLNQPVAQLVWYGVEPTEEDTPVAVFGSLGFYELLQF